MTYASVVKMSQSPALVSRVSAAVASQPGFDGDPLAWAQAHIMKLASASDWTAAWEYAEANWTLDNADDTGRRPGVINDGMILAAVQAALTSEAPATA